MADNVIVPPVIAVPMTTEKSVQYIDVTIKIGIKDIEPFYVDRCRPTSLENWIFNLECKLQIRVIPTVKWATILRAKFLGAEVMMEHIPTSYEGL